MTDDVEREATHDWLANREPPEDRPTAAELDDLADAAPQVPCIADSLGVLNLVHDLVDNMSSVSPGEDMFYVDRTWANALITAVTGEDMDLLEVDQDDYADTAPEAPLLVRGPDADRQRLVAEALPHAGGRGVLFIPDELAEDLRSDDRQALLERLAKGVNIPQEVMDDVAGHNHWQRAELDSAMGAALEDVVVTEGPGPVHTCTQTDGTISECPGCQADGTAASLAGVAAADTGPELGEDPEEYPDYPCPRDPDGLHFPGCGCEHY